jgi:hypothetical protein
LGSGLRVDGFLAVATLFAVFFAADFLVVFLADAFFAVADFPAAGFRVAVFFAVAFFVTLFVVFFLIAIFLSLPLLCFYFNAYGVTAFIQGVGILIPYSRFPIVIVALPPCALPYLPLLKNGVFY